MFRCLGFRLFYRLVFASFCVIFVCSYSGESSRYDRQKGKTEPTKFKRKFTGQDPGDGGDTKQESQLTKIDRKGIPFTNTEILAVSID